MKFDFDDSAFDEILDELNNLSLDIECPECNFSFEISSNDVDTTITCPHCGIGIVIESE